MRLLLVEDDAMLGEALTAALARDGHGVDWARDGAAGETALAATSYDAVLLDLGLPRKSGLDLLRGLRARKNALPVLILTARDAIEDRVAGLDAGADDYMVKPFDVQELCARLRALARRAAGRARTQIEFGALVLDPATHAVSFHGAPVALSAREFALLHALLERPGAILSKAQLEERLYHWGEEVESNAVEVHIHNLRRKLTPALIKNVRGLGWRVAEER